MGWHISSSMEHLGIISRGCLNLTIEGSVRRVYYPPHGFETIDTKHCIIFSLPSLLVFLRHLKVSRSSSMSSIAVIKVLSVCLTCSLVTTVVLRCTGHLHKKLLLLQRTIRIISYRFASTIPWSFAKDKILPRHYLIIRIASLLLV